MYNSFLKNKSVSWVLFKVSNCFHMKLSGIFTMHVVEVKIGKMFATILILKIGMMNNNVKISESEKIIEILR